MDVHGTKLARTLPPTFPACPPANAEQKYAPLSSMTKRINFDTVRELALKLPDVEDSTLHGIPSLKVRGKLLTCQAMNRSAEPNTLAVRLDVQRRAELIEAEPRVYYVTDHYVNYPTILVRLDEIDRSSLEDLLGMAWRFVTSKTRPKTARRRKQR